MNFLVDRETQSAGDKAAYFVTLVNEKMRAQAAMRGDLNRFLTRIFGFLADRKENIYHAIGNYPFCRSLPALYKDFMI